LIRFFIGLAALTALIASATLAGVSWGYFAKPSFFVQTLIFVAFATSVLFRYLYRIEKPEFFSQLYLLSMVLKFVGFLAYCLVIILQDREGALENIVFFLISYFSFTALEVGLLFHKISKNDRP
jgi:hypothetical protein